MYNHGKDANGATVGWTSSKNPVMYGENSHPGWSYTISQHNGANVYIRDRASCQAKVDAEAAAAKVEAKRIADEAAGVLTLPTTCSAFENFKVTWMAKCVPRDGMYTNDMTPKC